MKTIVNEITGRKDFPIFNGTNEQIAKWFNDNFFDFVEINEEFSCNVSLEGNELTISGDEDFHSLRIIDVKIIDLK